MVGLQAEEVRAQRWCRCGDGCTGTGGDAVKRGGGGGGGGVDGAEVTLMVEAAMLVALVQVVETVMEVDVIMEEAM